MIKIIRKINLKLFCYFIITIELLLSTRRYRIQTGNFVFNLWIPNGIQLFLLKRLKYLQVILNSRLSWKDNRIERLKRPSIVWLIVFCYLIACPSISQLWLSLDSEFSEMTFNGSEERGMLCISALILPWREHLKYDW